MLLYNHPANNLNSIDKRLIEIYGEDQCKKWKDEAPSYLNYHSFELVNGHQISHLDDINLTDSQLEELESLDPVNFPVDELLHEKTSFINPNRYNVKRSFLNRKYYKIGITGFVLILLSGEELRKMFGQF